MSKALLYSIVLFNNRLDLRSHIDLGDLRTLRWSMLKHNGC